jgi:hypothetical protein
MRRSSLTALITSSLLTITICIPVRAQADLLQYCKTSLRTYVNDTSSQNKSSTTSSTDSSVGISGTFKQLFGIGVDSSDSYRKTSNNSSASNQHQAASDISRDCDEVLRQHGLITVAEINANRDLALQKMRSQAQMYGIDAWRDVGLDANYTDRYKSDNQLSGSKYHDDAWVKTTEIQSNASTTNTIINTAGGVVGGVVGAIAAANNRPPSAPTSVPTYTPPTAVASVPSDPVSQLLAQWGWIQTICVQGKVMIVGLSNAMVCVEPTSTVPPGNYRFANNQLYPLVTQNNPQPAYTPVYGNPQPTYTPVYGNPSLPD